MKFKFETSLKGAVVLCTLEGEQDIESSVLCFSLMAPGRVVRGGSLLKRTGGFHEVLLPKLEAGKPHSIMLSYADPEMTKTNRAW